MSPSLRVLSGASVIRILIGIGFTQVSQRGSHVKLRPDKLNVIVPLHRERSILHQADLTVEEFTNLV